MLGLGYYCGLDIQLVVGSIAVLFFTVFLWNKKCQDAFNLPPGPPSLPLVGSLPWLGIDIREPLRKMSKRYGEIMTIYLGTQCTVILNSYELIKDAFAKNVFSGRPQSLFFVREISKGKGIITSQGTLWQEQRQFVHRVLRDFGMGRSILEEKVTEELHYFIDNIKTEQLKQPSGGINPRQCIQSTIANVIGSVVTDH